VSGYASLVGADLARVLAGDGWHPKDTSLLPDHVVLWKDGGTRNFKPIAVTLYLPIGRARVEAICAKAGISATRFEDLYMNAVQPEWLASGSRVV
jgi:hypothetical protein